MLIKWDHLLFIIFYLGFIFQKSFALQKPLKVSVLLFVYESEKDILWDLDRGTLHENSEPILIRNGQIEIEADRTVREMVEKAMIELCKDKQKEEEEELLDEDGDEKAYQIVAIFVDKQLNMQIQREMNVEPNIEYTAILLLKKGQQKETWLF